MKFPRVALVALRTTSYRQPLLQPASATFRRANPRPAFLISRTLASSSSALFQSTAAASTTTVKLDVANPDMFCRQCEQTRDHFACTTVGVCGKSSETAAVQDTLIFATLPSVARWAMQFRLEDGPAKDKALLEAVNEWTVKAAFSTLTNVNFSDERIAEYIWQGQALQKRLQNACQTAPISDKDSLDVSQYSTEQLETLGHSLMATWRLMANTQEDATCLKELGIYGLKGVCAYAAHVWQLQGTVDEDIMKAIQELFVTMFDQSQSNVPELLSAVLKVGQVNGQVLAALDQAHADLLGAPVPTSVATTAKQGPAILISGHDMADLLALLQQTEGTGVNVYTHGEMLPAHSYPKLKAFSHLAGNYGTAWQNQKFEFAAFPGPVVVTTNCIIAPRKVYKDRLYTMNEVGIDGVKHLPNRDFSAVIAQAQQMKGFERTVTPEETVMVGFNHRAVLPLASTVLDAVAKGQLSRIFLIGGCDGSQWDRNYFTDVAEMTPDDSLILTLGCAKNRLIHSPKLQHAKLANGLPRVLDMGQCNDSYSAVVVATELAKALNCSVNDLPLSLAISHLEQKAAAVLLTLLNLGVKNIRLGPSIPAYLSPNVLAVLQKEYNLMATGDAKQDVASMMVGA